jgi:hypothetical protein
MVRIDVLAGTRLAKRLPGRLRSHPATISPPAGDGMAYGRDSRGTQIVIVQAGSERAHGKHPDRPESLTARMHR